MSEEGIKTSEIKKRLGQLLRFVRFLIPYWDKQVVLYLCTGFSLLFGLAQPYLSRLVIDFALIGRDLYLFNMLVLTGIVIYLFSVPIELIQKYISFYLRTGVSFALRSHFYRHLQMLSLRFAQSRTTGEHLYRLGPDLENVVSLVVDTIPAVFLFPLRIVLLFGICLWLSWSLTLIVLAASPLVYLHVRFFTKRQYALSRETTEASQEVSSRLQESLALMKWIKIFGKERFESGRYLKDVIGLIRLNIRNLKLSLLQSQSSRLMNAVLVGGITYLLGFQVIKEELTLGLMTALSIYLFQLLSALKGIGGFYSDVVIKFIAMDRVIQTLDAEIEVKEAPRALVLRHPRGGVELRNVTFGYLPGHPVLRGLNLEASPGEMAALVGPSGAGKTTMNYLLLRLYDPWDGAILIDGHDIRTLDVKGLRRMVGLVSHEPFLLKGSVLENIRFGNPRATEQEVIQAARLTEADGFIMELPDAYDTEVGEGAHLLSQGQRQRLAIARVLLMNPKILILDEAMSALPLDVEERILGRLMFSEGRRTILVISHRLSVLRRADRIYVLDRGVLEEQGSHGELMDRRGCYFRLYQQASKKEVQPVTLMS